MKLRNNKAHHHTVKLMGCAFVLTAIHDHPQIAWNAIRSAEQEIIRIEKLISSWRDNSQTSAINRSSGIEPVQVDEELFNLIVRSKKISRITCGAFDISGTLSRYYWNFNKEENALLPLPKIQELIRLIGHEKIVLDRNNQSVFLTKKGMKIGFGGIGKGYAAECAKKAMMAHGISDGLINASGDLAFWGRPPGKDYWDIHIPDPRNRNKNLFSIGLESGSVVTSGSYENYTLIDGKRYSHIINPRSGMPITHTKNATVICPDAELGDGLATAFSVLPIVESTNLCSRIAGAECIIIDANDDIHFSNQLKSKAHA